MGFQQCCLNANSQEQVLNFCNFLIGLFYLQLEQFWREINILCDLFKFLTSFIVPKTRSNLHLKLKFTERTLKCQLSSF